MVQTTNKISGLGLSEKASTSGEALAKALKKCKDTRKNQGQDEHPANADDKKQNAFWSRMQDERP